MLTTRGRIFGQNELKNTAWESGAEAENKRIPNELKKNQ
jgi:hypothetical protein